MSWDDVKRTGGGLHVTDNLMNFWQSEAIKGIYSRTAVFSEEINRLFTDGLILAPMSSALSLKTFR